LAENIDQIAFIVLIAKIPHTPQKAFIRRSPAVAHNAVFYAEPAGYQGGPGGQTGCVRTIVPVKPHPFFCDLVDMRGSIPEIAVTPHVIRPQGINVNHQNAHISTSTHDYH
jgi:hypothetical protein